MTEQTDTPGGGDTPPLPGTTPETGQPDQGDNQDVAARKVYPTDPTGADPE
jgi:hypothetical protein